MESLIVRVVVAGAMRRDERDVTCIVVLFIGHDIPVPPLAASPL